MKNNNLRIMGGVGPFPAYLPVGENDLIMPKSSWDRVNLSLTTLEEIHDMLDIASFVPVLGTVADIANATVYAMEKKYAKMWMYLGFVTLSVVTAGLASSSKAAKTSKAGITLTEKAGAKKLPKGVKTMSIKAYEKNYGKEALVEVTSYNRVDVASKGTKAIEKAAEKLTLEYLEKLRANGGIILEKDAKKYISLVDKTVNEGKQGKHILGHNNYKAGKSYITIPINEVQELVNKYAGTGELDISKGGKWTNREVVTANKTIGVAVSGSVENITKQFKIHYSKEGVHIVPYYHD